MLNYLSAVQNKISIENKAYSLTDETDPMLAEHSKASFEDFRAGKNRLGFVNKRKKLGPPSDESIIASLEYGTADNERKRNLVQLYQGEKSDKQWYVSNGAKRRKFG